MKNDIAMTAGINTLVGTGSQYLKHGMQTIKASIDGTIGTKGAEIMSSWSGSFQLGLMFALMAWSNPDIDELDDKDSDSNKAEIDELKMRCPMNECGFGLFRIITGLTYYNLGLFGLAKLDNGDIYLGILGSWTNISTFNSIMGSMTLRMIFGFLTQAFVMKRYPLEGTLICIPNPIDCLCTCIIAYVIGRACEKCHTRNNFMGLVLVNAAIIYGVVQLTRQNAFLAQIGSTCMLKGITFAIAVYYTMMMGHVIQTSSAGGSDGDKTETVIPTTVHWNGMDLSRALVICTLLAELVMFPDMYALVGTAMGLVTPTVMHKFGVTYTQTAPANVPSKQVNQESSHAL